MTIRDDFETVLTSGAFYSADVSPEMEERQVALRTVTQQLTAWLPELISGSSLDLLSMSVEPGGRVGQFGPIAWVRVYSPAHSPRATEGFYVVYLFAGDGSAVYLSLNQGTSEFRSGKMRPIMNTALIEASAAEVRNRFEGWTSRIVLGGVTRIELGVDSLLVNPESKQRARNYEAGNVFALTYPLDSLPDDEAVREDLGEMLSLLSHVYAGASAVDDEVIVETTTAGQRRARDAVVKKAIENHAMDRVKEHYVDEGWSADDVSRYRPYDYVCRRLSDDLEVHVEVKGTTSPGRQVFLSRNEVEHARQFPAPVLAVVHGIKVVADGEAIVATGGTLRLIDPWTIDESALVPMDFTYALPPEE